LHFDLLGPKKLDKLAKREIQKERRKEKKMKKKMNKERYGLEIW
jgi:hypothetical protein